MDSRQITEYELQTLSSYEPEDLDNPEFEICYEDNNGSEGFMTMCIIDVADRAYKEYFKMIDEIAELKAENRVIETQAFYAGYSLGYDSNANISKIDDVFEQYKSIKEQDND